MAVTLCPTEQCTGCWACYNACPENAVAMRPDGSGFLMPEIDAGRCTSCGKCVRSCPILHPAELERSAEPKVYACWSLDETVRRESASGGMFTVFADYVLRQGGVVFGAAFDNEMNLHHEAVRRADDLQKLRSSKYLQSHTEHVFREVKQLLGENTPVLFTGTSCQIAGLYAVLDDKRNHPKLLTCDLICHGVPNQLLFRKYVEALEKKYGSRLKGLNFRHKRYGWRLKIIQATFDDGRQRFLSGDDTSFLQGFGDNKTLRSACHTCGFKTLPRVSDITLGDFWSIGKRQPFPHDVDKGVSVVLLHSERGERAFAACRDQCFYEQRTLEEAEDSGGGQMLRNPARAHPLRESVFRDLHRMSYQELAKKYLCGRRTFGEIIRTYFGYRAYMIARLLLGKGRLQK